MGDKCSIEKSIVSLGINKVEYNCQAKNSVKCDLWIIYDLQKLFQSFVSLFFAIMVDINTKSIKRIFSLCNMFPMKNILIVVNLLSQKRNI